ncbi:BURP domain-containing protein 3-like isoform X2 [Vitis riparia]|uniref:BURP domain-containing protein 3-like isoform X2 n=1 Tax=Vitis riparia TaxID=96939 RepID=UPI00155AB56E|nr:BURP domain-containing protein 3-like isoform X2 [Vitis riparia]
MVSYHRIKLQKGLSSVDASTASCTIHIHFDKFSQPAGEEAQVDDSKIGSFLETDLHPGKKMKMNLATTTNGAVFLPHQVAESIPFSSNKLPEILNRFSLKEKSTEAEIIKELEECEEPAMEGEARYCTTSLESLIDFSTSKLGRNVNVLANEVKTGSQEYEFGVGMEKLADKSVVCYKMNYPYVVFYCHTFTKTRTYMIPLVGADGSKAKAMSSCHSDRSAWHPKHVAFKVLNVKPGTVPVCHFVHNNAMVWIPK